MSYTGPQQLTLEERLTNQIEFLVKSIKDVKEKLKKEGLQEKQKEIYKQNIEEYMELLNEKHNIINESIHEDASKKKAFGIL